jgi:hypothetical protein
MAPIQAADGNLISVRSLFHMQGNAIERTDQVEHHRWTSPAGDRAARGLAPLDGATLALLYDLRWRKPPRDRRRLWIGLLATLLLHALFVAVVRHEMRPPVPEAAAPARERDDALQVRLIESPRRAAAPAPAPPAQTLPPPPAAHAGPARPAPRPAPSREASKPGAMTVTMEGSQPAPAPASSAAPPARPKLFSADGQVLMPANAASAPPAANPGYVERKPTDEAGVMQHKNPVTYKPTRFEHHGDAGRSAVDDALQKASDATTAKHTFDMPGGLHVHCQISLVPPGGGCGGDPPPPPPPKDGDERLSMAPAAPLAKDPNPQPPPPSVDECIKIYRAGKPLPYGCPLDTPTRSVDADMREHARHGQGAAQPGH